MLNSPTVFLWSQRCEENPNKNSMDYLTLELCCTLRHSEITNKLVLVTDAAHDWPDVVLINEGTKNEGMPLKIDI